MIAAVVVLVAGCSSASGVAARIRAVNSPLVRDVEYKDAIVGSNPIRVYLVPDTTLADGHRFWCDVVVPAAGADLSTIEIVVYSSDPPQAGVDPTLADKQVTCPP